MTWMERGQQINKLKNIPPSDRGRAPSVTRGIKGRGPVSKGRTLVKDTNGSAGNPEPIQPLSEITVSVIVPCQIDPATLFLVPIFY